MIQRGWSAWVEKEQREVEDLRKHYERIPTDVERKVRFRSAAGAFSGPNAERKIAASVEVAKDPTATATFAPLPLSGIYNQFTDGLRISLGTSTSGSVQLGAAWSFVVQQAITLEDIGLSTKVDTDVRPKMLPFKADFEVLCRLLSGISAGTGPVTSQAANKIRVSILNAREACGFDDNVATRPYGFTQAVLLIRRGITAAKAEGLAGESEMGRAAALSTYLHPTPLDEVSKKGKELPDLVAGERITRGRWVFIPQGGVDIFPILWGFNPDLGADEDGEDKTKELPKGQWKSWKVGARVTGERGRFSGSLEMNYVRNREAPGDSAIGLLSPGFQASVVVANLDGMGFRQCLEWKKPPEDSKCVTRVNRARTVNGKLPPRLVFGTKSSISWDPSYDGNRAGEVRQTSVNAATLEPYLGVLVSDKLAFQMGLPFTATLVEQKEIAAEAIPNEKDLQWSVPIYAAVILSN